MAKKSDFELQEEQIDDISENEIILKNKFDIFINFIRIYYP